MSAAPARLVVGAGCSRGCPPEELRALVDAALADAGFGEVVALATIDARAEEPCIVATAAARSVPLQLHTASALARVRVPTPSRIVERHVGTPSVAEAAALLSAGPGAALLVGKRRSEHATCAVAAEAAWHG